MESCRDSGVFLVAHNVVVGVEPPEERKLFGGGPGDHRDRRRGKVPGPIHGRSQFIWVMAVYREDIPAKGPDSRAHGAGFNGAVSAETVRIDAKLEVVQLLFTGNP